MKLKFTIAVVLICQLSLGCVSKAEPEKISPGDQLKVIYSNVPTSIGMVTFSNIVVSTDGLVVVPPYNLQLKVKGMTTSEAEKEIYKATTGDRSKSVNVSVVIQRKDGKELQPTAGASRPRKDEAPR